MSSRTPYIHICAFLFFMIIVVSSSPAQPDSIGSVESSVSLSLQTFVRDGLTAHKRHDISTAINYFSRALRLDPSQKTAREHLAIINAQEDLPPHQKAQLFLLEDLFVFLENLRARADYFRDKCDGLRADLLKEGYTQTYLEHQLSDIKGRFFRPPQKSDLKGEGTDPLGEINASLSLEKEGLSQELFYRQRQYAWLRELSHKASAIFAVEMIVDGKSLGDEVIWPAAVPALSTGMPIPTSGRNADQSVDAEASAKVVRTRPLDKDNASVKAILKTMEDAPPSDVQWREMRRRIVVLQEELRRLRQEMNGLQQHALACPANVPLMTDERLVQQFSQQCESFCSDLLRSQGPDPKRWDEAKSKEPRQNQPIDSSVDQAKDQRLADLTGQVIDFSLKLAENEMILNEKIGVLASLNKAYDDLQSRFDLGHKIIQEKNAKIQYLSERLEALEEEIEACGHVSVPLFNRERAGERMSPGSVRLAEMEGILRIYAGKMEDASRLINAQNAAISALEEQLTMVRAKLFEKETAFERIQKR